jgi:hypothetical protein
MESTELPPDASPAQQDQMLALLLEEAVRDGERAVERTPEQLEVLREAGVVDAGAYGLVVILAGVIAGLRGDEDALPEVAHHTPAQGHRPPHEDSRYRYCTNFIVTGHGLDARAHVGSLEEMGDSVLVVGDDATLKVHVHTDEPEAAMSLFEGIGAVSQLDVADMREQVAERTARLQADRCAVVAVASGDGMRELYEGMGAFVVDGGSTFNPSISDLLAAIHEVPSEEVLVLPNNRNVVMAAERAAELSDKHAMVVDCTAPQAGVVAAVEVDPGAPLEENAERLVTALEGVRTGSVAAAARDDAQGRFVTGDAVGFVGDEVVAWGGTGTTLAETMSRLAEEAEILTVIAGEAAPIPLAELESQTPDGVELELHEGGQQHYWWLLAAQ